MKFPRRPAQLLAIASLVALPASPTFAADAKTEMLQNAQGELETLKNRYTDTHPRVVEQKERIAQLQYRIDAEKTAAPSRGQIIRTEVRLLTPKADGGFDLLAAPSLITQSGQEASLSIGVFGIGLNSTVDDKSNITTSIELSVNASDDKPAKKIKLPLVTSRPGERSTVSVQDGPTVEILATLVEPKGISVDFPGGSLAQLLAVLSKSNSQPFNLIAPSDALTLELPQISIRNVRPRDLALALDQLLDGWIIDLPAEYNQPDGLPVFTLRPKEKIVPAVTEKKPELFMSYSLGATLQNRIPVSEVIDTINTAWTLDPAHKSEDLKLKYHAATGILLVSSREKSALELVDKVIQSLYMEGEFRRTNPQAKP